MCGLQRHYITHLDGSSGKGAVTDVVLAICSSLLYYRARRGILVETVEQAGGKSPSTREPSGGMAEGLSSIGLLMAGATSVSNVVKDMGAKKVVDSHDLVASTFCIRFFSALVFIAALAVRTMMGLVPRVRDGGALFGIASLQLDALLTYSIYLGIDVVLVVCSTLLYYRANELTPISLCMPDISFTPVFLIITGYVINGEATTATKGIGVVLICLGSIAMHRRLFAQGWLAPIKAIWLERGCFFMLLGDSSMPSRTRLRSSSC